MVSTNVVDLGLLDERPDVRLLKMFKLILVRSSEMSAHATVVASNNHTALAGGLDIIDTVLGVNACMLTGLLKRIGVLVLANAANVENRVLGEHVLLAIEHQPPYPCSFMWY